MDAQSSTTWRSMRSRIAAGLLAIAGVLIMGMGAYFALFRPAFLPEDLRFIGNDAAALAAAPGITAWLRLVFVVLGAYTFTTGLFTAHVAFTALRAARRIPLLLIAVAGLTSLGVMVAVNFALRSDFRYLLASVGALWALAVCIDLPTSPAPRNGK
jgi:hypothetical protein